MLDNNTVYTCSNCQTKVSRNTDHCPKCGLLLNGVKCKNCGHIDTETAFFANGDKCPKCNSGLPKIREINESNFENEVLKSDLPVLVDFWAPWCGPCRALAPVIDKIATEYEGKVIVGKLNVDEAPAIASQYSIMSIPSVLLFVKGEVKEQVIGLASIDKLKEKISTVL